MVGEVHMNRVEIINNIDKCLRKNIYQYAKNEDVMKIDNGTIVASVGRVR